MPPAAAFFDLDRTLLRGASAPLLTDALVTAGIAPDRHIPGQELFFRFYELVGESLVGMALARQAANLARGWLRSSVQEAAEKAAESLAEIVAPYARPLIAEHQREGRQVVLATTTPHDMVAPLAERLRVDDVIATPYVGDDRGRGTRALAGGFVWFTG